MICQAAIVVELATSKPVRSLARNPAPWTHQVCLPKRYAHALAKGRFVVVVDGKPVALSNGKVAR